MKVLVTGGTGFLGSAIMEKLQFVGEIEARTFKSRHQTKELLRSFDAADFFEIASLGDMQAELSKWKPEFIIHCATHFTPTSSPKDVDSVIESNLIFSIRAIEASLTDSLCGVITLSSFWQKMDLVEDVTKFSSPYAATKSAFDSYLDSRIAPFVPLRRVFLGETFGTIDSRPKLIPHLIRSSLSSLELRLRTPNQRFNLSHQDRLAEFILEIMSNIQSFPMALQYANYLGVTPRFLRELIGDLVRGEQIGLLKEAARLHRLRNEGQLPIFGVQKAENLAADLLLAINHQRSSFGSYPK